MELVPFRTSLGTLRNVVGAERLNSRPEVVEVPATDLVFAAGSLDVQRLLGLCHSAATARIHTGEAAYCAAGGTL